MFKNCKSDQIQHSGRDGFEGKSGTYSKLSKRGNASISISTPQSPIVLRFSLVYQTTHIFHRVSLRNVGDLVSQYGCQERIIIDQVDEACVDEDVFGGESEGVDLGLSAESG